MTPRPNANPALALLCMGALVAACTAGSQPIPSGARTVHVVITDDAVELDPSVVGAGDVYLVLDEAVHKSFVLFGRQTSADASPGPLSEGDIARIGEGDTQGTFMTGLDAGGCSAEQDAAARGQLGPCGNVMKISLSPGLYAILGDSPDAAGEPLPIGVLEVTP
ncbi:MAG TPA: hypothetical protein VFN76_05855 [Candidatus Limnocylindria bacterium]|nr:hypothetical protein [Candidatus Limnocylindria bacterium]